MGAGPFATKSYWVSGFEVPAMDLWCSGRHYCGFSRSPSPSCNKIHPFIWGSIPLHLVGLNLGNHFFQCNKLVWPGSLLSLWLGPAVGMADLLEIEVNLERDNPVTSRRESLHKNEGHREERRERERESRWEWGESAASAFWVQVSHRTSLWLLLFEPVLFSLRGSGLSFCNLKPKECWPILLVTPVLAGTCL